ncbi:MAG: hypothetical protein EXR53_05595 [Dehalococcoidia bacterium]|nr:hypothetical protein [Dehalococcoidia bacterium]
MVKAKDDAPDIRARDDAQFKKTEAYYARFVPGKVVHTGTKVVTQKLIKDDRLELENPEWDFPRGGAVEPKKTDNQPTGPNMRQTWHFYSPPRVGEKVTVKHTTVDKFIKSGIKWIVEETATFGDDGRPICSNTGTWMMNGHRMGERWAKETQAKKEGPYIK